jgi:serine phosphatase RsbU (regulator of sigma subunit)
VAGDKLTSRISIKWIMPPLLVLPVVVVAFVLTLLAYTTGKRSADDLANQNMLQIHGRIEEHLTRLLDMPSAINELNKRMLDTGEMSLSDADRNRVPVFETLNIFQAVSSVVIGSAEGPTMWVIRYPGETTYEYAIKDAPASNMVEYTLGNGGVINSEQLSSYAWQPTVRPWYTAAIEADGPTWGEVYIWLRNGVAETLGVPYVEPYRDEDGNIIGVVCTELTLSDISSYLGRLTIGKTGKAFIVETNGDLVAASAQIETMKDGVNRLPAGEAADPWIAAAAAELTSRFGDPIDIDGPHRAAVTIEGQPMRLVVSPYENRRNLEWLIATVVPDSDFLADVEANRAQSTWFGGLAVVLMVAGSVLVVFLMLKPILALSAHAKRISEGHLDETLELSDSLEMAQLSQSINRMVGDLQDRVRLRHALSLAMDVQQSLLPNETPSIRGIDIAARAQYCDETGGDYFDYLDMAGLEDKALVVALGDVMGHGVAAAMLMATARGMFRSHVRVQGSLNELMTHVNELLVRDTAGERFMTMLLFVVDTTKKTLRWASAGHDAPFLYEPQTGQCVDTGAEGGLPLGIMPGETFEEQELTDLHPGQIIIVGTDGLWESRNPAGEQYGRDRLKQAICDLADQDAKTIEQGLYDRLTSFCGDQPIDDDVTYVVLKITDEFGQADIAGDI